MRALVCLTSLALLACHSHHSDRDVTTSIGTASTSAPRVPALTLNDQDGKPVALRETLSGRYGMVFFYPEADTPG